MKEETDMQKEYHSIILDFLKDPSLDKIKEYELGEWYKMINKVYFKDILPKKTSVRWSENCKKSMGQSISYITSYFEDVPTNDLIEWIKVEKKLEVKNKVNNNKSFQGKYAFNVKNRWYLKLEDGELVKDKRIDTDILCFKVIEISELWMDIFPEQFINTMVHEMIHLGTDWEIKEEHGGEWKMIADYLNNNFKELDIKDVFKQQIILKTQVKLYYSKKK